MVKSSLNNLKFYVFLLIFILLLPLNSFGQGQIVRSVKKEKNEKVNTGNLNSSNLNEQTSGYLNGYKWVDLGLPSGLKWATLNIGAKSEEDQGMYYSWGEINLPYDSNYAPENCKSYKTLVGDISGSARDVATKKWGNGWRMPLKKEIEELYKYCSITVKKLNGKDGYEIKGPNGNSIFMPVVDVKTGTPRNFSSSSIDTYSCYWSGTERDITYAFLLHLDKAQIKLGMNNKFVGYPIRAVTQ